VLGVSDQAAPSIADEVEAIGRMLPEARVFTGAEASRAVLEQQGASSRFIHIATHGFFRQDNPMFSGIRLGDAVLSLYDLYHLSLPAELVTLSGCATGMSVVAAGDELLGLVRGLLGAGACSVLLTLWDVHDHSTAEFMKSFYTNLLRGADKDQAVRQAMLDLRASYPHPYHWAPFSLIGKTSGIAAK
jgi:CHAT domain-containing protein